MKLKSSKDSSLTMKKKPKLEIAFNKPKKDLIDVNDNSHSSCDGDKYPTMDIKQEVLTKWEPPNWELHLKNIREMRKHLDAPVDNQGCERCMVENYSEKEKRFHTLVSLMISSQTKDTVNYSVMEGLRKEGLSPESIVAMSENKLSKLLYPVSFYKNKAKYIKKTSQILVDQYSSDIPKTVKELVKLPGVGPKMAYLAMNCAWNEVVGIGVDVHVHRITNRLGWVKDKTKEPEKTRKELEDWLPCHLWKEVNWLLVGFGQQICKAHPKCDDCLNKSICPGYKEDNISKSPIKPKKSQKLSEKKGKRGKASEEIR